MVPGFLVNSLSPERSSWLSTVMICVNQLLRMSSMCVLQMLLEHTIRLALKPASTLLCASGRSGNTTLYVRSKESGCNDYGPTGIGSGGAQRCLLPTWSTEYPPESRSCSAECSTVWRRGASERTRGIGQVDATGQSAVARHRVLESLLLRRRSHGRRRRD